MRCLSRHRFSSWVEPTTHCFFIRSRLRQQPRAPFKVLADSGYDDKKIAETMAVHPGRSIPQLCGSPYAVKATYNLFKHEEATPDNIQAGHRAVVLQEMRQPGVYLLFHYRTLFFC